MNAAGISGCKVFTATRAREREELGEAVTRWLAAHPDVEAVRTDVMQSSDAAYHCLSIVCWFRARET